MNQSQEAEVPLSSSKVNWHELPFLLFPDMQRERQKNSQYVRPRRAERACAPMGRIPSHLDATKKKRAINGVLMKTTRGEIAKPFDNLKTTMKRPSILSKTKILIKKLNQDRSIRKNRIKLQRGLSRLSYRIESSNR